MNFTSRARCDHLAEFRTTAFTELSASQTKRHKMLCSLTIILKFFVAFSKRVVIVMSNHSILRLSVFAAYNELNAVAPTYNRMTVRIEVCKLSYKDTSRSSWRHIHMRMFSIAPVLSPPIDAAGVFVFEFRAIFGDAIRLNFVQLSGCAVFK